MGFVLPDFSLVSRVTSGEDGILAVVVWLMGIPNGVERPASMLELLRAGTSHAGKRRPGGANLPLTPLTSCQTNLVSAI